MYYYKLKISKNFEKQRRHGICKKSSYLQFYKLSTIDFNQ
jgi:hypothetical protein